MVLMLENFDNIILSLDSQKSVPAPFLTKTYQLVDEAATNHIVSWGEDDTTFVVWSPPEFARDLLPNYFKHNNFSSFVRQLNTYGFRKIAPDRWEFANEFFKRGEKHLLCQIHRRKTSHHHSATQNTTSGHINFNLNPTICLPTTRVSLSPPYSSESDRPSSPPSTLPTSSTVAALTAENGRLRRCNTMLLAELAHIRKLYNNIIYFVQNHVKPVAPASSLHHAPNFVAQKLVEIHQSKYSTTESIGLMKRSSLRVFDEDQQSNNSCKTKLFGVLLHSKKRLHPDQSFDTNYKARLVLAKDDLSLNLMPPSC